MNDMVFYARLHAEAMADAADRHGEVALALALRVRGAERARRMAWEVGDE